MVVALGKSVCVTVVAEGIETAAQAAELRALGVPFRQGYAYGKPVTASPVRGIVPQRRGIAVVR
ncbi:MAG: hypothetical protein NVSMB19_26240 [Vulcanimicrobiaceae bacterium]